uniref:Uncharacterized protein n=1 Tax=Populus alba TaxID=43335 RepID=A0A4U5PQY4_POPAL|nr:hypothetical protein D5086_0000197900 [Populus alba]
MEPFPSSAFKFSFEYLLLPPRSAPTAAPPGLAPRVLQRPPRPPTHRGLALAPTGRVSAQLGTVTRLPVHPASPVLLTKKWPTWSSRFRGALNEAAAPSYLFKSLRIGRGRCAPDASNHWLYPIELAPSSSYPEENFGEPATRRHSSPSFGSRQACSHSNPSQKIKVGRRLQPSRGDPASQLPCALRVYSPVDSHTCQTPWSVFKTGRMGSPQADARSAHVPGTPSTARIAAVHGSRRRVSTGVSKARALAATAIRIGPRPEPIGGPAVTVPHPDRGIAGPHPLPPDNSSTL